MNDCEECIEYRFHNNLVRPYRCLGCGNMTMKIVQSKQGYYHAECSLCKSISAWSDCTPCGGDEKLFFYIVRIPEYTLNHREIE